MSRKSRPASQSRRRRLRRPARLVSARAWISKWMSAGRQVRAGDYAARYGVDRYIAHLEMVMLKVPIAPGDRRYAVRPPPPTRVRRRQPSQPVQETLDLIEWGGQMMFVVGCTSGGAPYGPSEEEMEMLLDPADVELLWGEPW